MLKRYRPLLPLLLFGLSIISLVAIFATTNPRTAPSALAVVVFGLIYLSLATGLYLLIRLIAKLGLFDWSQRKVRRAAMLIAMPPTFLILLQSIGQLSLRDGVLVLVFVIILALYLNRNSRDT